MKKVYKNIVMNGLRDLASYDFQKKAWFSSTGPKVSDYAEDMCVLFDDSGLKDALNTHQVVFGKKADDALRELDKITDQVHYRNVPRAVLLNSPQMQIVREKAAEALKLIALNAE